MIPLVLYSFLYLFSPLHPPLMSKLRSGHLRQRIFSVSRAVRTAMLRSPASLGDRPPLPAAAFGVYAPPLYWPDIAEAGARTRPQRSGIVPALRPSQYRLTSHSLLRSRSSRYIHISALATMLLARVLPFGASTSPFRTAVRCHFLVASRARIALHRSPHPLEAVCSWRDSAEPRLAASLLHRSGYSAATLRRLHETSR
jgi:hypothetical protein